jgi:hypothetical protein
VRDVLAQLERWLTDGERAALATVIGGGRLRDAKAAIHNESG